MKKCMIVIVSIILAISLCACGTKKCHTCGKALTDGGYQAFGNYYCDYCFKYDLGLD